MSDPQEILTREVPAPQHTLRYGAHEQQLADVWQFDSDPAAIVLFLHGGFWREKYDRQLTAPSVRALAQLGYVAVNVEYHRIGNAGGNPQTFDDIADATDWLPELVCAACGLPSTVPVLLAGHSSGGHLALWASMRHRLPITSRWHDASPTRVAGVLSLAGVCSVAAALADGIGDHAAADLLADEDNLDEIDPGRIGPGAVPTALVHGRLDQRVPNSYSVAHRRLLATGRSPARLDELASADHFEVIDPATTAWPVVCAALDWLVRETDPATVTGRTDSDG